MSDIRILGIGSPFGDDQLGWHTIDALKTLTDKIDIILEKLDRPGTQLLEYMQGAEYVYLIDAIQSAQPPGTLHRIENQNIEKTQTPISSHNIGLAETITLGRTLHCLPPHLVLYGIELESIQTLTSLSKPVQAAIPRLAQQLASELNTLNNRSMI